MTMLLVLLFLVFNHSIVATRTDQNANGPELKLTAENAKLTSNGIYQTDGRFAGWISTTVQIFWDIQFTTSGNLDVAFSIGNDNSQAGNTFEITLGDDTKNTTIRGTSTASGGYFVPKLMPMGSLNVVRPAQQRLAIRAVSIKGGVAGDLYYVSLTGPAAAGAKVVNVYPSRADSTHLWFEHGNDAMMLYNEIVVEESFPATYFCTNGFNSGYYGIQHNDFDGRKQAIFSLWDVVDQENKAANDELAGVVRVGKGVTIDRFGGEGTGYKSTLPFQWKIGEKVQLLLMVEPGQNKYVHYTAFLYMSAQKQWKLMATLRREDDYKQLKGFYAFLEDWLGGWGYVARSASFNPWVRKADGSWIQSKKASFTRTGHNANVNGWSSGGRFFMRTGGDTVNEVSSHGNQIQRATNDKLPESLTNIDEVIKNEKFLP